MKTESPVRSPITVVFAMLCFAAMGCIGAPIEQDTPVEQDASSPQLHEIYPIEQHRHEPVAAYAGLQVEQVDGETGNQNTGEFMLAGGEPVAIVQVWCHDEGAAWYLVPDLKIRDGLVEFQCAVAGPWRALIIH